MGTRTTASRCFAAAWRTNAKPSSTPGFIRRTFQSSVRLRRCFLLSSSRGKSPVPCTSDHPLTHSLTHSFIQQKSNRVYIYFEFTTVTRCHVLTVMGPAETITSFKKNLEKFPVATPGSCAYVMRALTRGVTRRVFRECEVGVGLPGLGVRGSAPCVTLRSMCSHFENPDT